MENSNNLLAIDTVNNELLKWSEKLFSNLDISENTKNEYASRINLFIAFIQDNGFNKNSYLEYKRHLAQRTDLSISTKNKYLIVARVYCKELQRQGFIPSDITQNIKSFQQSRKHKKEGLTEDEIQKILIYIQSLEETCDSWRKKALLSLLILQGLRQVEIIRLNVTDIDLIFQTAFIQGKGKDDKEKIDLHPVTVITLKQYIRIKKIADGALFTSTSNHNKNKRLTTRTIRNIINPILKELGIEKTVHGFRHYFTTKLIQTYKGDLLTVAYYTRHKNLEMLQVYNDNIKHKEDLPRYYKTFESVDFEQKNSSQFPINHITGNKNNDLKMRQAVQKI